MKLKGIKETIAGDLNLIELLRGGSVAFIYKIAGIIIGYLLFFVLSRAYGAEFQGVFSVCWTVLMISMVISRFGFDTSIVKYVSMYQARSLFKKIRYVYFTGLGVVFIVSLLVSLLLWIFSKTLSDLYFQNRIPDFVMQYIAWSVIPFAVMTYNAEAVRGVKKIGWYSIFQNGTIHLFIIFYLLISLIFKWDEWGIYQYLFWILVLFMLVSLVAVKMFVLGQGSNSVEENGTSSESLQNLLKVSFPMLLTNSIFLILSWTDIQMLGILKDEASVGIYNIAVKIAALNVIGLSAVNTIASPKFSELYTLGNKEVFKQFVRQTSFINTMISLPVLIMIFLIPEFLLGLFGGEFTEGKTAMMILAVGQFLTALLGSVMYILNMTGHEKAGRNIIFSGLILNIVLNYLFIPRWGINGAAIATTLSTITWRVMAVVYIYRRLGFLTLPVFNYRKNEIS